MLPGYVHLRLAREEKMGGKGEEVQSSAAGGEKQQQQQQQQQKIHHNRERERERERARISQEGGTQVTDFCLSSHILRCVICPV